MKAAILTYHDTPNYGATLQCYALTRFLQRAGADVEVINYTPIRPLIQYGKSMFLGSRRHVQNVARIRRFWEFARDRLPLSGLPIVSRSGLRKLGSRYDLAIVGSDEVWRVDGTRELDPSFYLDFCDPARTHLASYAASCSTIADREAHAKIAGPLLARFGGISVRDPQTSGIVQDLTGETPVEVLDPTFLWDFEEEDLPPKFHEPYIAVYAYLKPPQMRAVRELATRHKLKVVSVGAWNKGSDATFLNTGPLKWMRLLKRAELVVTNYFHGAVFSLLFKRRHFAFVDPVKRMKLSHLYDQVGQRHVLHECEDVVRLPEIGLEGCELDYALVKKNLAGPLQNSVNFLTTQLKAAASRLPATAVGAAEALRCAFIAAFSLFATAAGAADYHVDAAGGDDTRDGTTLPTAWKTLARATEKIAPGDSVRVHPGVYFGPVQLKTAGLAGKPIRFTAEGVEKNRVILSNARREIRQGEVIWRTDDAKTGLFSLKLDARPGRVLAGETDLFPYASLDELKRFTLASGVPGPAHGYAYDDKEQRLHVRLRAADGSLEPGRHTLKVAPPATTVRSSPASYNFGVLTSGPAHVVIEGFTFETPGLCGVFAGGGSVTVRDSWFLGCRTGVAGRTSGDGQPTDDVIVERCDFSQTPAFADVEEIVARAKAAPPPKTEPVKLPPYYWNVRSGSAAGYESGIALNVGARWKILANSIHDVVDGLSHASLSAARDVEIARNTFTRIVDNAIEVGNHSSGVNIHHNSIIDAFEALSWNPKDGTPWPGSLSFHHNTVTSTLRGGKLWAAFGLPPSVIELKCDDTNWSEARMKAVPTSPVKIPGTGLTAYNNTIILPTGDFFSFGGLRYRRIEGLRFLNNIVITRNLTPERYRGSADLSGMEFDGNLVAPGSRNANGAGTRFAGRKGQAVDDAAKVGFTNPTRGIFGLQEKSPALGRGVTAEDMPGLSADIGAFAKGSAGVSAPAGPALTAPITKPAATPAPAKP